MKITAFFLALVLTGVVGRLDGHNEEATMLLDDSKTTTHDTPANARVNKDVKDARKLKHVLDQVTTYTGREVLENDKIGPSSSWCANFDYVAFAEAGAIPMSSSMTPIADVNSNNRRTLSCEEKISCDFSALTPNAFEDQALFDSCGDLSVFGTGFINVFDSGNITRQPDHRDRDADLGSPNIKCNSSATAKRGPGRGKGGTPNATFPNCDPLGNLLIVQNPDITDRPNDDANGNCIAFNVVDIFFESATPVSINDIGLLDIEEGATISGFTIDFDFVEFTIDPRTVGNNGHWIASKTKEGSDFLSDIRPLVVFFVCMNGSGAVSFVDFTKCTEVSY